MRVAMLGPIRVGADDGSTIEVGGTRLRMLLARLALDAGQVVSTDALIDGLWGDSPPTDATNALQSLVSRLRRALRSGSSVNGADGILESHPVGYRLAVDRDDVDVYRFELLAAHGHAELRAGRTGPASSALRAALELWRGPAMADLADAPFAGIATTRLAELRSAAIEDRIEADILLGRHDEVLAELRTLLTEQPLRERLSILLIKALYLAGRQADALAAFDTTRRALADELGVEPSAELRQVHLAVLRRDPDLVPAVPAESWSDGRSRRLPARLTSFVGRQRELREIVDRLADARLVTLVGPGGAGKTRLATEVAGAMAPAGGMIWFVELAGVGEATDVAAAVLAALGIRETRMLDTPSGVHRPADTMDRLVEALVGQHCLVVLDNCEHVITAAAALVDTVLARCPALRVLATSREPLAITGETAFPIGPLELPAPNAAPEDIGATEAVRLFAERAASANPGFVLDEQNESTVAEICRRLDGLPLALELAAARLRSMTVGQIADRLDDRFRLLTAGSRTSLPRHRTLRAVVEWSWDLLEKPERILARRLSVFAAGATVGSATAVCAAAESGDLPPDDVLYVLASLVEKSLVTASEGRDGQPRYRMLETVRAYAAERLTEAGEDEPVRAAFSDYFLDLVEDAEPRLRGPDQVVWLAMLSGEQDNFVAAVRHAADAGDSDTAVRLAVGTTWFWMLSGRQREALDLATKVVELPGSAPTHARAALRAFATLGTFQTWPDRRTVADVRAELVASNAMLHYPILAMLEPLLAAFTGDTEAAWAGLERGAAHPDPWGRAAANLGRAFFAENEGMPAEAEEAAVRALREFRDLGDRWGQAMAHGQVSERLSLRGDHAGATAAFEESIRLVAELGALDDMPEQLVRLAAQRLRAGDVDGAERDVRSALELARNRGAAEAEALALCMLANVLRRRGDIPAARKTVEHGSVRMMNLSQPTGHWAATFHTELAGIAVSEGDAGQAMSALRAAADAMVEMPDMPVIAAISEGGAYAVELRGDAEEAARLVGVAAAIRGTPDLGNTELAELIARLTATLGEPTYLSAYDRGATLSRDAALAELAAVLAGVP